MDLGSVDWANTFEKRMGWYYSIYNTNDIKSILRTRGINRKGLKKVIVLKFALITA